MRRRTMAGLAASGTAIALIVGASVLWPGLDAQRTPPRATSAWVLQSDGLRYARINTVIDELDTVRSVSNPSRIVQTDAGAFMFTDNDSKLARIDEALPVNLDADGMRTASSVPSGTEEAVTGGDFVAYRTDAGAIFAGRLSTGVTTPVQPTGGGEQTEAGPPAYTSDAIAVDSRGMLLSYSAADGTVIRIDLTTADTVATDTVSADIASPALTAAGEHWVLVDTADGTYWTAGAAARPVGTTGSIALSLPDPDGDAVYLADETGLVRVGVGRSADQPVERVFGDRSTSRGTPARPVVRDGVPYAAWLGEGQGSGTLWDGVSGDVPLDYAGQSLSAQRRPVFVDAGDTLLLNDARSGWVWTVPDGELVPSSQQWDLEEPAQTAPATSQEDPPAVMDPRPPVAVDDAFGVRAGALVTLPVLLNDHDPNQDVLTIDPASVQGLDPGFGTLSVTDDRQRLAVRVAADAAGTATLSYAVSDGTAGGGGLMSAPATVTLRVAGEDENSAPQWCSVDGCQQQWPQPEVAPGGTVSVPVLGDWVDPEGDAVMLLSAGDESGIGQVVATPQGRVVFQHQDAGQEGEQLATVSLVVSDARGATATKALTVRVRPDAPPQLQSFSVVDTAGSPLSVDVAEHTTGAAGEIVLTAARVLDDAAATATVVGGSTRFDFRAAEPGSYRVAVTVASRGQEASGTVQVTLLPADASAQLSTAPVVAFVRPQADATVDVLTAVSNPTGRVLLLSDVVVQASQSSSLTADAVGQSQLRVAGSTATGDAGLLGTVSYRVGDGTADEGASAVGEATVYLLPPAAEAAPITVDDAVVVRAGAQLDIPVLDNDVAGAGRPRLDPDSVTSSTPLALAFASGDLLRYLAPDQPGQYTVSYRAFSTGSPGLSDGAVVRVQVVASDANRDPLPVRLTGRVASGSSTAIAFDGFGMDPDGDVVRLDRILTQPERGAATISADGTEILYTSLPGSAGQDSFTYRVVDPFGATGEATVRIGVRPDSTEPSPITFTDYVYVQAGEGNVVRVHPLSNDIDPLQGTLTLVRVRPDVPELALDGSTTPEFERLSQRVEAVTGDTVTIGAPAEPGTMGFLYDVESASGNTARGLIVVRVVPHRVPDYPVVTDTVLSVADRGDLAGGVDVLTGKVLWSGGETSDLTLGLWGDPPDVRVDGAQLIAEVGEDARTIPFSVTGTTAAGPVTTYGFLRVPPARAAALTPRPGIPPITVDEGGEVDIDLTAVVAAPRGGVFEVGTDIRASGARAEATCAATAGTSVRYAAGEGAPWSDACVVTVRLIGATDWTVLSVPITVIPRAPLPVLSPASLEVAPGERHVFDLSSMTTWQGRPEPVQYAVDGAPASFTFSLQDTLLTVQAADTAVPGTIEGVQIQVTSHAGVAPARLALRVGAAPQTLPQGGAVSASCSQADGDSCLIEVIGAPGEVNPLPDTALQVVDVAAHGRCDGVAFEVASATAVRAVWTADAPGASCTGTFTVRDAQGRQSVGARDGAVTVDLQGFPSAPASVSQVAYADGSLTLAVDPGPAQSASPAVTGFEVRTGDQLVAVCTPQGVCPALEAPNGEPREYRVVSVNAVGPSRASVQTTAWAYDPPTAPAGSTATPIAAGADGGMASLTFTGVDAEAAGALAVSSPVGDSITVPVPAGQDRIVVPSFRVGANTATAVTVTPISRFEVPPGVPGPAIGSVVVSAHGIGAPTAPVLTLSSVNAGEGRADITATGQAGSGGDGSTTRFGFTIDEKACVTSTDGASRVFRGLPDGRAYTVTLCAESWFDGEAFARVSTTAEVRATQSGKAPTGYTFVVGPDAHVTDGRATWTIDEAPTSPESPPYDNVAVISGLPSTVFDADPGIRVRYEHTAGWWQSEWGEVTPAAGSAPYQVQATWQLGACRGGTKLEPVGASSGDRAAIRFDAAAIAYYDAADKKITPGKDPWMVPKTAVRVEGVGITVDWSAQRWGLDTATATISARCTPASPSNEDTP